MRVVKSKLRPNKRKTPQNYTHFPFCFSVLVTQMGQLIRFFSRQFAFQYCIFIDLNQEIEEGWKIAAVDLSYPLPPQNSFSYSLFTQRVLKQLYCIEVFREFLTLKGIFFSSTVKHCYNALHEQGQKKPYIRYSAIFLIGKNQHFE